MKKIEMCECSKRKLDELYIVIYAIKNEVNIKKADYIEKSIIYTLVGIDTKGYRQLIDVCQDKVNNNRYWLDFFVTLKGRGLKKVLFLSVDDNKNMKRAAKIVFSDIVFVDSPTDFVPKFYKYTSEKSGKQVGSKLFKLYTQKTLSDFKENFETFKKTYNNVIHQKLIEKYLKNIEQKIDNAYNEVFGQPLENNEIKKDPTMTDIFGNPIKEETINKANEKQIEEMFTVNGINLKQFKEEDQNYLKQNYNEQNYQNIINTLNRNNINLDNVYYAPNIFVEMTDSELENILNKLIGAGQSLEAIGLILEKFPRIKNYNLDQAIMNYGEYIKDIDITELIMKAKELSNGGN